MKYNFTEYSFSNGNTFNTRSLVILRLIPPLYLTRTPFSTKFWQIPSGHTVCSACVFAAVGEMPAKTDTQFWNRERFGSDSRSSTERRGADESDAMEGTHHRSKRQLPAEEATHVPLVSIALGKSSSARTCWQFGLVVTRWSRSTKLGYSTRGSVSTGMGDRVRGQWRISHEAMEARASGPQFLGQKIGPAFRLSLNI